MKHHILQKARIHAEPGGEEGIKKKKKDAACDGIGNEKPLKKSGVGPNNRTYEKGQRDNAQLDKNHPLKIHETFSFYLL
jgi:hypothetical protein